MSASFVDRLAEGMQAKGAPCAVGIDPLWERFSPALRREVGESPEDAAQAAAGLERFGALVVDAVADLVAAVKFQIAYYEIYGSAGLAALERSIAAASAAGLLVIVDAKRGDIGATSQAYARAFLSGSPLSPLGGDALTLSPYLGSDSIEPFAALCRETGRGLFVCAKTSNPGGALVQDVTQDGRTVYERVAGFVAEAGEELMGTCGYSNLGIVVGATAAGPARALRRQVPKTVFLMPGLGAQKGDAAILREIVDGEGLGAVVAASRSVTFPHLFGDAPGDPKTAIRAACRAFIEQVAQALR